MKIDLSERAAGRSVTSVNNRYAAFAEQLAERSERLRAATLSEPPVLPPDEPESRRRLTPELFVSDGALGLLFVSAVVLAIWGLLFQPSNPLPPGPSQQAQAVAPAPDAVNEKYLPPTAPPAEPSKIQQATAAQESSRPPDTYKPMTDVPSELAAWQAQPNSQAGPTSPPAPLSRDEVRELQGRLKSVGFSPGPIDGVVGSQTQVALRKYADSRALPSADPTTAVLTRLRTEPAPPK
jgi:hypothetical protein